MDMRIVSECRRVEGGGEVGMKERGLAKGLWEARRLGRI